MTRTVPPGLRLAAVRAYIAFSSVVAALALGLVIETLTDAGLHADGGGEGQAARASEAELQPSPASASVVPEVSGDPQSLVASGPALDVPKEVLHLLDQRKRFLDQREEALRVEQGRLSDLKRELEDLLDQYEASVKAYEAKQQARTEGPAKPGPTKKPPSAESADQQAALETVTKIFEAMPAEEAAVRIEKMPSAMAVKVLRSVKSKIAGAILAQVRPDKAAKLTAQIFSPTPKQPTKK